MTIESRLAEINQQIQDVCKAAGRSAHDVHLVAVSKRHPVDAIINAKSHGQVDFGENFAQELRDKAKAIDGNIHWHFIGRLQKNKVKYIANTAFRVHCLESAEQAEALAKRAHLPVHCLVGVNIGREPQKSGLLPADLQAEIRQISKIDNLQITGLMCLPPNTEDPEQTAPYFEEMQYLLGTLQRDGNASLTELSMGMSSDFHVALRYGATWIRVGSAIFGERPK